MREVFSFVSEEYCFDAEVARFHLGVISRLVMLCIAEYSILDACEVRWSHADPVC